MAQKALAFHFRKPPDATMGRGTREQRETMAPETPELRREVDIAKTMARRRPDFGLGDLVQSGFTLGLKDEAEAAGAGVASLLTGNGFSRGYDVSKEAINRLENETRANNPTLAPVAQFAGGMASVAPKAVAAAPAVGAGFMDKLAMLGRQMREGAIYGGAIGGVTGAAEGEGLEGRLGAAAVGTALGVGIGGAAPAVLAPLSGVGRMATNYVRGLVNPEQQGARTITAALDRDAAMAAKYGRTGELSEQAYDEAMNRGLPVAAIDAGGETTRRLFRSATNTSAEANAAGKGFFEARAADQSGRLDDVLARQSATRLSPTELLDQAQAAAKAANDPAYKAAMAAGDTSIWNSTLERLAGAPAVQKALKSAIRKAEDSNIAEGFGAMKPRVGIDEADNLVFRGEGGLPSYPNLRLWDLTKRELDDAASEALRTGRKGEHATLTGIIKQLRTTLDAVPTAGPLYKQARATASKFFGETNAYKAGQAFAAGGSKFPPDAAKKAISQYGPEEQALFKEGYIAAERFRISQIRDRNDLTVSTFASPDARLRAEMALGRKGAKELAAQIEVEQAMRASRGALGNSSTVQQAVDLGMAGGAGSTLAGYSTGDFSWNNLAMGAGTGAALRFGQRRVDERLARRVGEMLLSKDPRTIRRLASLAARYPAYLDAVRAIRIGAAAQGANAANTPAPTKY
jgi:hypothetical protein